MCALFWPGALYVLGKELVLRKSLPKICASLAPFLAKLRSIDRDLPADWWIALLKCPRENLTA
ncbi:MAG: hypothetical protein AAGI90_01845 [Chlamydiota bacterium]